MLVSIYSQWSVLPRAPEAHFARFPNLAKLVVQLLYNRGITQPDLVETFIQGRDVFENPFDLAGVGDAAERILAAIEAGQSIIVYGDYDADGVTSTALLTQALCYWGGLAQPYIPDRFEEGYGLNQNAIRFLAERGADLIITVDCGIRSAEDVIFGQDLGLTFIITDHHQIPKDKTGQQILPPALAVINPKRSDSAYDFEDFAGVGVAFKLVQGINQTISRSHKGLKRIPEEDLLDLVALGTVADMVPLKAENRHLVQRGLQVINHGNRLGIQSLLGQSQGADKKVNASTIGFVIGPRLNAAGRLSHAQNACDLLLSQDLFQAQQLAHGLNQLNLERQDLTQQFVDQARQEILAENPDAPLHVVAAENFNHGIVGLVASRLTDEFYRPVLVAHAGEQYVRGSGRSIPEFNITEALDQCADLLLKYGGHAAAAGFTLAPENLPRFKQRLTQIARDAFAELRPQKTLCVDAVLNLRGVNAELVEAIQHLEPFGYGNPVPKFSTSDLEVRQVRRVGRDGNHLKLKLFDGKNIWDAIGFRLGDFAEQLRYQSRVDAAYTLEFNTWQGQRNLQLNLEDLRIQP